MEPGGAFWEIAPSPFYRRDTWGPENTTGQSHSHDPHQDLPHTRSRKSFLSQWLGANGKEAGPAEPLSVPTASEVCGGPGPDIAKMAGFFQQWGWRQLGPLS